MQIAKTEAGKRWLDREDNRYRSDTQRVPSERELSREEALTDFYGEEAAPRVMANLRPEGLQIGELLRSLLSRKDVTELHLMDELKRNWPNLIGKQNAAMAVPAVVRGNVLYVEVCNATWMYILRQQLPVIERRVSVATGGKWNQVRLVVGGTGRPGDIRK